LKATILYLGQTQSGIGGHISNQSTSKEWILANSVQQDRLEVGRRVAILSISASAALAIGTMTVGLVADATSVVAAGVEFAGDILASAFAVWPLIGAILIRSIMSTIKFGTGRRIQSVSLVADAWNDAVDILSAAAAFVALTLTLWDPSHFPSADRYGASRSASL
jgi:divalent metal cation (Fe/Co/Zn/Cd) transporter